MQAGNKDAPQPIYRQDYQPPDWLVESIELYFEIADEHVDVTSTLSLKRNGRHARPLVLDGRQLELRSLRLDGEPVTPDNYDLTNTSLVLGALPDTALLEIQTRTEPRGNTSLEGLYAAGNMLCTQCEAHGFSRITYFPDRPDILARYRVTIEADSTRYPTLLSNGNRVAHTMLENGRQQVQWDDPFPKPCYLFALVAGDLACVKDHYLTGSGRTIAIEFYVEHGRESLCGHAVNSLKQAMAWDEATYSLEYDLDTYMVVAVSSFNMGAMENKGLNIFNDRFVLVSPKTATDSDHELVTAIIGHEYFHNWTGNRVTCRDWFQLSLKEGLTVFREQQFMQDCVGGSTQRIEQVRMLRERQFPEDAGPLAHPVRPDSYIEINNFYTATVYEKGAELVRMLHGMLGQEAFARGLRSYLKSHDGQAATIEDFVEAMQNETETDLGQFFRWYSQAGTPEVTVREIEASSEAEYRLEFTQFTPATPGQAEKQPLLIPLRIGLLGQPGQSDHLVTLNDTWQEVTFGIESLQVTPVFLRGFSAPVHLNFPYSADQLARIVLQEEDGYARWEAMQRLYLQHMLGEITAEPLIDVLGQILASESDCGLLAELLTLPTENQLIELAPAPVKLDQLLDRRDGLLQRIGLSLAAPLSKHLNDQEATATADYSIASAAKRRLHAICLLLVVRVADEASAALAEQYYQQASNMSDTLAAMQALRDLECEQRERVMQDFYARWSGQPLVLDKWFAIQACTHFGEPATRIRRLLDDQGFDLRNPNRVRALIGAFAMNNPRGLHDRSGAGYALLQELLPKLDSLNPQVSARMAQSLSNWHQLDADRKRQINHLLQTLMDQPGLSADLKEILAKLSAAS